MSFITYLNNHHNNHAATVHALSYNGASTNYTQIPLLTTTNSNIDLSEDSDRYYPFWLLILIAVFGSVTSVLTVLGNILVMLAFFLDQQIRQPTNYFILSLSVSDFLIGLLSMPILTIYIYSKEWPLNAIICDIWLSLDYTVCLTSIYTVLFITIDRFCSVKIPAKYRKWRTKRKINIMIAGTWAVPTIIFFASTIGYSHSKGMPNMQNGTCDVQWNKSPIFNLCLTIGYFWTTLFVMIILYIFIYGVASNLEKKSRENARKMSSLVGMAGNAMAQIGMDIGVNKFPNKLKIDNTNYKSDLTNSHLDKSDKINPTPHTNSNSNNNDNNNNNNNQRTILTKQSSIISSERRHTNDGIDDENSVSFESHSDVDLVTKTEKNTQNNINKLSENISRRMSFNWPANSISNISKILHESDQINQKPSMNVKSFAHSIYRNSMRLSGLSSSTINHIKQTNLLAQPSITLTPIPSESELSMARIYPPPQPRPESLAIMSDELFNEKLKARQSPIHLTNELSKQSLHVVNNHLSIPTNSNEIIPEENLNDSNQTLTNENFIENDNKILLSNMKSNLVVKELESNVDESSDESWRLLNSNTSLDIPYIDETDFEDLGYILHRRCVQPNMSIHEQTILYQTPNLKQKLPLKLSLSSLKHTPKKSNVHQDLYSQFQVANRAIAESSLVDSEELILCESLNTNPSNQNKLRIRHSSLRHLPQQTLVSTNFESTSPQQSLNKNNIALSTQASRTFSPPINRNINIQRSLLDYYHASPINDIDEHSTNSESDILSNYKEMNQETSSLLHLNERYSSAFIDDDYNYQCNNNLMKMIILNKTAIDSTSDEQTLTNSISLNTYSQDCSIDRIYQPPSLNENSSFNNTWTSSSSSPSSETRQIPQHLLAAIEKKRNTSSDSDAITTTTTTLTTSTLYGELDKRNLTDGIQTTSDHCQILDKNPSDLYLNDIESSSISNRIASKVTFESFLTQNSVSSSPKTKDQSVMAQIDVKGQLNYPQNNHQPNDVNNESKNAHLILISEDIVPSGQSSAKPIVRELIKNKKSVNRRKSKSQNRARKALRTITFILGAFVICWTPWHVYSAIHSLCQSCKTKWIFANPVYHCVYFLCYLNSPINPFCYALANQQFKKTFTRILRLDLRRL